MTLGSFWSSIGIKPNWVRISPSAGVLLRHNEPWHGVCRRRITGVLHHPPWGWKAAARAIFERAAFLFADSKRPQLKGNGELGPRYRASQGYRRPRRINMHQGAIPGRWGNRLSQDLQASAPHAAAPPRWMRGGAACSPDWGWIRPVGQFSLCPLAGSRDCSKGASLGCPNSVLRGVPIGQHPDFGTGRSGKEPSKPLPSN